MKAEIKRPLFLVCIIVLAVFCILNIAGVFPAYESASPGSGHGLLGAVTGVLDTSKQMLEKRLYEVFPEQEGGVLCDLLLGDKEAISDDIKDLYRRNGIAHILSISGVQTLFSTYPFILQAPFYGISRGYISNSYIGSRRYLAKCNRNCRRQGYYNLAKL